MLATKHHKKMQQVCCWCNLKHVIILSITVLPTIANNDKIMQHICRGIIECDHIVALYVLFIFYSSCCYDGSIAVVVINLYHHQS